MALESQQPVCDLVQRLKTCCAFQSHNEKLLLLEKALKSPLMIYDWHQNLNPVDYKLVMINDAMFRMYFFFQFPFLTWTSFGCSI